nr:DNA-binding protein [Sphingomonas sp. Y57]
MPELAACCDVHKNTVRHWQRQGLQPIDKGRPLLFHGGTVRAFLIERNAGRKRPCLPGTLYCLRCREARRPALDMVDYVPLKADSGDLRALCENCEAPMHRRARKADLAKIMPGLAVRFTNALPRLSGRPDASLNCDEEGKG